MIEFLKYNHIYVVKNIKKRERRKLIKLTGPVVSGKKRELGKWSKEDLPAADNV